jgi:DNA repair exonuclease SbcCD ATPase subunit/DNA repair exonuclease SbcCD nuclease subunit
MIKKIIHISDVHIRLLKRHKEYRQVFGTIYKQLKQYDSEETIIVLVGDILHSKTDLSPEAIALTSEFLISLTNILPVVMIAGNHDGNLSNDSRMDALTPIVDALNIENLYYFKDTGIYDVGDNLQFGVASVFNKVLPDAKLLDKDKIKIALYHGIVNGALIETGFRMTDGVFDVKDFDGYDLALLGDIHKPFQFMNKKKTVAYPGTFIAQNYGEKQTKRGYLVWDLETMTSENIIVPNDYAYITLNVKDGLVDNTQIPNKPRIRFIVENTDLVQLRKIIADIKAKYDVQEVIINRVDNSKNIKRDTAYSLTDSIRSPDFQNGLIKEFLKHNTALSTKEIENVTDINIDFNDQIQKITQDRAAGDWKLKSLEFDNLFSYGKNNKIDFTKLSNTVGIFGPNHSGKSSLIDIILFALFDKSSRAFRGEDVLNVNKDYFYILLNFELDGTNYFIKKTGKRRVKGSVRVDIEFWSENDGIRINLNSTQRRQTAKEIRKYVGELEDFILTSISLQNDNTGFIDMKQTERKEFLSQILKMELFDDLYQKASDASKELKGALKEYQEDNVEEQYNNAKSELDDKEDKIKIIKKSLDECNKSHKKSQKDLLAKTKQLRSIKKNININVKELKKKQINVEHSLVASKNLLLSLTVQAKRAEEELEDLNENLPNKDDVMSNYKSYQKAINLQNEVDTKMGNLTIEMKAKLDKLEKLKDLEYNPNCNYCMNNVFVKDAISVREQITFDREKLNKANNIYKQLVSETESLEYAKKDFKDYEILEGEINCKEKEISNFKISLLEIKNKKIETASLLKSIENSIDLHNQNKEDINYNEVLQKEIDILVSEKDNVEKLIRHTEDKKWNYASDIKIANSIIQATILRIGAVKKIENDLKYLNHYISAISRDGIPYTLISQIIPALEEETNNILSLLTDFGVLFEIDDKSINLRIIYDENTHWPIELASGFEKFIASLAIRIAITKISNLPKPNFIAIDEGWGNFDSENLSNVGTIFNYLKTQFDFALIISHIDALKGAIDNSIAIQQKDGFSQITN